MAMATLDVIFLDTATSSWQRAREARSPFLLDRGASGGAGLSSGGARLMLRTGPTSTAFAR